MGRCTVAAAMTGISLILGKTGAYLLRLRAGASRSAATAAPLDFFSILSVLSGRVEYLVRRLL